MLNVLAKRMVSGRCLTEMLVASVVVVVLVVVMVVVVVVVGSCTYAVLVVGGRPVAGVAVTAV